MGVRLPTVKVVDPDQPDDFIIINESDFDGAVHTPWKDKGGDQGSGEAADPFKGLKRPQLVEALEAAEMSMDDVTGTGKDGAVKNSDIADALRAKAEAGDDEADEADEE